MAISLLNIRVRVCVIIHNGIVIDNTKNNAALFI